MVVVGVGIQQSRVHRSRSARQGWRGVGLGWLAGVLGIVAGAAWADPLVSTVTIAPATITASSAVFSGTVDPNGTATAWAAFEYGPGAGMGQSVLATPRYVAQGSPATGVSATVTGLNCNTSYSVRLNGGGTNGSTNTFTTGACALPGAPTGVTAVAGDGAAVVTFTPPADNGGSSITQYKATASPGGASATCAGPGACAIRVSGLSNGTGYTFSVTATNSGVGEGSGGSSGSVTPSAGNWNLVSARLTSLDLSTSPTTATLEVVGTVSGLGAGAFAVTDQSVAANTVTVSGVTESNGVYTVTLRGVNVADTYALTVTPPGYAARSQSGWQYGIPATLAHLNLVDEPNIFTTYTRTLTAPGVVTIGNATYAANAKLYSGSVYTAIDGNNGNPDNGTVTRLVGIFGKAPAGAQCVKTLRTNGALLQVATDSIIDNNPNYQEAVVTGQTAYNNHTSLTEYWRTILFLPMYSQIATAQDTSDSNSRTLVQAADRFRIIEWYGAVDGSGNCTGLPIQILRLLVTESYTGNVVVDAGATAANIASQPQDQSTQVGGSASLTVGATASGTLSYKWYSSGSNSNRGGTLISGATGSSYTPPTGSVGITYYYVEVTNTSGGNTSTVVSRAARVAVGAINGVCGSAQGNATAFVPSAGLCAYGNASAVANGSPWTWTCTGIGSGASDASCSAPNIQTATATGLGRAVVGGNAWVVDSTRSAGFIPVSGHLKSPPSLPPGVRFPHGLLDFTLISGTAGSAATITITYPSPLPANVAYWKYGPSPAGYNCSGSDCASAHWYQMPASQVQVSGNTLTLTIYDGGVGDDDLTANQVIVDQGGPAVVDVGVPSLNTWGLLALSGLLGLLALGGPGVLGRRRG